MVSKWTFMFCIMHVIHGNLENAYIDYLYSEEVTSTLKSTTESITTMPSASGRTLFRTGKRKPRESRSMNLFNPLLTSGFRKLRGPSSWEFHNSNEVLNPMKRETGTEIPIMATIYTEDLENNSTELQNEEKGYDIIENKDILEDGIGAEPIDGPKSPPQHNPAELIRQSYQPFFICAKNSKEGIRNCRVTCDIRNRQFVTCLGKFCYCQTSYMFLKVNAYDPTVEAPFFHCGRYDLEGYEKCIERCRREPKATVQCGGDNCYCHYAAIGPFESDSDTNVGDTVQKPNYIRAAYCGRAPDIIDKNNVIRTSISEISGTKINMCKYRCPDGKYACDLMFCYCS